MSSWTQGRHFSLPREITSSSEHQRASHDATAPRSPPPTTCSGPESWEGCPLLFTCSLICCFIQIAQLLKSSEVRLQNYDYFFFQRRQRIWLSSAPPLPTALVCLLVTPQLREATVTGAFLLYWIQGPVKMSASNTTIHSPPSPSSGFHQGVYIDSKSRSSSS